MNTPQDLTPSETRPVIDVQRRRLTKGGLAAPIVIGVLLSRPVLGAAPHKCTISGQLSGNVSSHDTTTQCSSLGQSPTNYAAAIPNTGGWPSRSKLLSNNTPRTFASCPYGAAIQFLAAFERYNTNNGTSSGNATVFDVLKGGAVDNSGLPVANRGLRVKSGYDSSHGLELGKEVLAAYMNATDQTKYPISQVEVVAMFNSVIVNGGLYHYSPTVSWDVNQVLAYFKSLHT